MNCLKYCRIKAFEEEGAMISLSKNNLPRYNIRQRDVTDSDI